METATTPSTVSGAFVAHKCTHDAIFTDNYLRTNRTNHTKIMRCFPHCCPDHRQRSYCGSSVYLRVNHEDMTVSNETSGHTDFVVYAHFRPVDSPTHKIGDRVGLTTIESSLQNEDPASGEWIESNLMRTASDNDVSMFEINSSGRWYYSWVSAATITMRSSEHVFEAVVFRRRGRVDLEVVALVESPPFRVSSFRRGGNMPSKSLTNTVEDEEDDDSPSSVSDDAATRRASPTGNELAEFKAQLRKRQSQREQQESKRRRAIPPFRFPEPTASTQASTLPSIVVSTSTAAATPSSTAVSTRASTVSYTDQDLDYLLKWLNELPASCAGSRAIATWESLVDEACSRHLNFSDRQGQSQLSALADALTTKIAFVRSPQSTNEVSPLVAMDAAVRVLLNEWLDIDSAQSSAQDLDRIVNIDNASQEYLKPAHHQWRQSILQRAMHCVQGLATPVDWDKLVAIAKPSTQTSSPDVTSPFGYRSFVAQWRHRMVAHQLHARTSQRPSVQHSNAHVWRCRMDDISIDMERDVQHSHPLSILMAIHFWRHLSCIRLEYRRGSPSVASQDASLSVSSVFDVTATGMNLVLDGQYRWFNSLPNGDTTTGTTLMGHIVGDYIGHSTTAGTLHITTYVWPSDTTSMATATAYAWHWTIDGHALSTATMVVSVVVEQATVDRRCSGSSTPFAAMSMREKAACIGRWRHLCQLEFVYHVADS